MDKWWIGNSLFVFIMSFGQCALCFGQAEGYDAFQSFVNIVPKDNFVDITTTFFNDSEFDVLAKYSIEYQHFSKYYIDTLVIEDEKYSHADELIRLDQRQFPYRVLDSIAVLVQIRSGDQVLAVKHSSFRENTQHEIKGNAFFSDGEGIKNVVLDQTKSKFGRDVFDYFFAEYNLIPTTTYKVITIDELPARGTSTQIIFSYDNQKVFEFFTQPRQDYLQQMANYALQIILQQINQDEVQ